MEDSQLNKRGSWNIDSSKSPVKDFHLKKRGSCYIDSWTEFSLKTASTSDILQCLEPVDDKELIEILENEFQLLLKENKKDAINWSLAKEIWTKEKKRLCKPLLPKGFKPQPSPWLRHGRRQSQEILKWLDPVQPKRVYGPTNYKSEIVVLYEATRHEGEEKGRRFIRWHFIRDLENTSHLPLWEYQAKRQDVFLIKTCVLRTSCKILKIILKLFCIQIAAHLRSIKKMKRTKKWFERQEKLCLDTENLHRTSTKWLFLGFCNVDLKVVLDRESLLHSCSSRSRPAPSSKRRSRKKAC